MAQVIGLEQGKRFRMGGGDSCRLIDPSIGATQITLNYSVFQPGHEFPQHTHDASADVFIVWQGGVSVREGDHYTPIGAGDLAYIPAGEVHGTVNTTTALAILCSFQVPPDAALYQGQRDPAVTGTAPKPAPGHMSRVRIRSLLAGPRCEGPGYRAWAPIAPASRETEMALTYYELEPGAALSLAGEQGGEVGWFVWAGQLAVQTAGAALVLGGPAALFALAGEVQTIANIGTVVARALRCLALPS
jgi:quercetin dioxygenase-like cupin family protein